mmetsp:Transcript_5276/g.16732  ORF Transcript_5276/g.16732 Transcript_5276/m.16732 type:complete len:227 (+) Transcript_5276:582-1262(+)
MASATSWLGFSRAALARFAKDALRTTFSRSRRSSMRRSRRSASATRPGRMGFSPEARAFFRSRASKMPQNSASRASSSPSPAAAPVGLSHVRSSRRAPHSARMRFTSAALLGLCCVVDRRPRGARPGAPASMSKRYAHESPTHARRQEPSEESASTKRHVAVVPLSTARDPRRSSSSQHAATSPASRHAAARFSGDRAASSAARFAATSWSSAAQRSAAPLPPWPS